MNLPPELRAGLTSTDRWLIGLGLVTVCGLAWAVLAWQASAMMDMSAMGQSMQSTGMWSLADIGAIYLMWVVMMAAMMVPATSPDYSFRHYKRRRGRGCVKRAVRSQTRHPENVAGTFVVLSGIALTGPKCGTLCARTIARIASNLTR